MSWTYMLAAWILRLLSTKKPYAAKQTEQSFKDAYAPEFASTAEYFARFGNKVNFIGKTVLDFGCDIGSSCFYMSFNGAAKVVGTDINEEAINFAKSKLIEYPSQINVISFFVVKDLPNEQFDIIFSKDSFEHYVNPEMIIDSMKQYLKPNGILVIGFSPLWKSPYGGHLNTFSRWPWIHLLFPEPVLMQELRRHFKNEQIKSFAQIASGLNKITYERFLGIVKENGLEFSYLETNMASKSKDQFILKIFKLLSLFPPIRDYFTVSIYCILRIKRGSV